MHLLGTDNWTSGFLTDVLSCGSALVGKGGGPITLIFLADHGSPNFFSLFFPTPFGLHALVPVGLSATMDAHQREIFIRSVSIADLQDH